MCAGTWLIAQRISLAEPSKEFWNTCTLELPNLHLKGSSQFLASAFPLDVHARMKTHALEVELTHMKAAIQTFYTALPPQQSYTPTNAIADVNQPCQQPNWPKSPNFKNPLARVEVCEGFTRCTPRANECITCFKNRRRRFLSYRCYRVVRHQQKSVFALQ